MHVEMHYKEKMHSSNTRRLQLSRLKEVGRPFNYTGFPASPTIRSSILPYKSLIRLEPSTAQLGRNIPSIYNVVEPFLDDFYEYIDS